MNYKKLFIVCALLFTISPAAHALSWKGIFIAGDDSIDNFDRGREDISEMFSKRGTMLSAVQLSSSAKYIGNRGVKAADANEIPAAFQKLGVKSGEGCLIHMTSHGAKHQGFYLSLVGILPPKTLAALVKMACGDQPTVVMVSACYSGQFVEALQGPNRVILTAASSERPSFGCSADTTYTFWDACILSETPKSRTWQDLNANVQACITAKESALGAPPSQPQAFFGENTTNWEIMQ